MHKSAKSEANISEIFLYQRTFEKHLQFSKIFVRSNRLVFFRNEQAHRENERLKSIVEANSLIDNLERKTSLKMFEAQHVQVETKQLNWSKWTNLQALEADYSKLKQELERLVAEKAESGYANMNLKATFDRIIEENER